MGSTDTEGTAAAAVEEKTERQQLGGGIMDTVLWAIVGLILAGAQGLVVLKWLLSLVSEALVSAVELGVRLV